jgi:methylthioxylose transferase
VKRDLSRDLRAAAAAALLVVVAAVVGTGIEHRDGSLRVGWPPLLATWDPHIGPGTPAAIAVATAVVVHGPSLAARLPWRPLLFAVWAAAAAWTWSLALVDGWYRGIAEQLTTRYEYLQVIDRFHDIPAALRDFDHHILIDAPDNWPAHVAGHPPGATLTFVLLDRIGLAGGGWAGAFVITAGTTATAAVLIAVRALAEERLARRAAPFLVLAPAAVWVGTSADGYFAAVAAWAVAFLALAVTGRRPRRTGFAAGLLLGLAVYLSYGLTLFALIAATVLLLGTRRAPPLPYLLAGLAVVPAVFTALGFDWWEAYRLLVTRYHQGAGGVRPYGYWVWANLACTVFIVGPATAAGLRRTGTTLVHRTRAPALRLAVLVGAALLALLVADVSGMSKAETERIWLPFALWLLPSCAFLTGARGWLTAQAVLALLVNHLLLTGW